MKKVEKGVASIPQEQSEQARSTYLHLRGKAFVRMARAWHACVHAGIARTIVIASMVLGFGALAAAQEAAQPAAAPADPNVEVLRKLLGVPEPPAPEPPAPAPAAVEAPAVAAPAAQAPAPDAAAAIPAPAPATSSPAAPLVPATPPPADTPATAAVSAPSAIAPPPAAPAPPAPAIDPLQAEAVAAVSKPEESIKIAPAPASPEPVQAPEAPADAPAAAKTSTTAKLIEPAPAAAEPDKKAKAVAPAKVARPAPAPKAAPKKEVAKPAPRIEPVAAKPAKAAPEPAAAPAVAAVKKPEPAPLPPEELPAPTAEALASLKRTMPLESPPPPPAAQLQFHEVDVPAPGEVVSAENMAKWEHLLGPSVQWAIGRGAKLRVVGPRPMPMEPVRADATQRYHAQVKLSEDKTELLNYVAGIPFPFVTADEADAATKLMHNNASRLIVDDVDIRNFSCETGSLDENAGLQIERGYVNEHFRRLYYVSRFYSEPKPTWKNAGGVRNRELLYALLEPFDLKGAGFTYNRYLNPARQDDSWLYFPQQKRVRRLSTAQRSEGVFGQDIDLDSYGGFAGNPAWTQWRLLGVKTILASMHAEGFPPDWQKGSANFMFDDVWEPREVYVIEGVSKLPEYAFGKRIIYLDRESWLIPYTEIYDLRGGLWKALIQTSRFAKKSRPSSKIEYPHEQFFYPAFSMIDMQFDHCTRCQLPSPTFPGEEGWYINVGDREGTTEEVFEVSSFIQTGR